MNNSIYIHIPFCDHICSYCDFTKLFYRKDWADQYLIQLEKEIQSYSITGDTYTIFIGGGTPSALNMEQLNKLLDLLVPFLPCEEYTMECNPESLTKEKLRLMKEKGVNRISIGVQTFNEDILKVIERNHTSEDVYRCIREAKEAGFENISIDMMYNLPHQTLDDLKRDLEIVSSLPITHLSYYSLILESHTKLSYSKYQLEDDYVFSEYIKHYPLPFQRYEISNYALKGYESKHNQVYWHNEHYYGIGLGASGYLGNIRYTNTRSLSKYNKGINEVTKEELTEEDKIFEELMLRLRLVEGINLDQFENKYHVRLEKIYTKEIQKNMNDGLLVIQDGYLKTTEKGYDLLDNILVDFVK